MPQPPREKDSFDTAMDFFWGALGGLLLAGYISRPGRRGYYLWHFHFSTMGWWLYLVGGSLVGGALTGLYREHMQEPSLLSMLPRDPTPSARVYLWLLFAMGCGSVALAFLIFGQE